MYLLDTCTLLWLASSHKKLSADARQIIEDQEQSLFISTISAFEVAIKHRRGALRLPMSPDRWWPKILEHHGIEEISISSKIAISSVGLPLLHNDPCDRIIISTSKVNNIPIITPDKLISQYSGVNVVW